MSELKQTIRYTKAPDGRAIAWSTMGNGPAVVAFTYHGHLEAELRCQPFAGWCSDVARKFTLIRYNTRGSGLSDREFNDVTLESQVEDATAAVDAAGLRRFAIIAFGTSGGLPAIEFAARHPERVDRIVLYGGFARGFLHRGPTAEQVTLREALFAALDAGWGDESFRMLNMRQSFPGATLQEIEEGAALIHTFCTARQFVACWRWMAGIDVSASATRIACPTLLMHAREDPRVPFDEGRRLASLIPNAEFVPVESRNAWVVPSEAAYSEVMDRITEFLTRRRTGTHTAPTLPHLTPREHQVLELIAQGKDNLQIAAHLDMSEKTVRNHITPIFDKLQVENRAQAIVKAREAGMGKG